MQYHHIPYVETRNFCIKVFQGYGFTQEESAADKVYIPDF